MSNVRVYSSKDLVLHIFSRLRVKILLKFRSVTRYWKGIVEDQALIVPHLERSLVYSCQCSRFLIPTVPLRSVEYKDGVINVMEPGCPFIGKYSPATIVGASLGLVCLVGSTQFGDTQLVIYNPSTRQAQLTPQRRYSKKYVQLTYGFGCLTPNDYKVVVSSRLGRGCGRYPTMVYGQSTGSWGIRNNLVHEFDFIEIGGTYLKGTLHWIACGSLGNDCIATLDLCNEEAFKTWSLPLGIISVHSHQLGVLKGFLSLSGYNQTTTTLDIMMQKTFGEEDSWIRFLQLPLLMRPQHTRDVVPLWISEQDGELVSAINRKYIVSYDTTARTCRTVMDTDISRWFGDAVTYVDGLTSPLAVRLNQVFLV